MNQIKEDIKSGDYKPCYLLYGDEAYLRKQYKDKLVKALAGDGDAMNTNYFEGKDISISQVIDLAETLPFLAERRVIVIENSGFLKSGGEELANYLAAQAESTNFVIVEAEADKRSKLFKTIEKNGHAAEFKIQDDKTLLIWIGQILKNDNKKISNNNAVYLLEKTGTDMANIRTELEKLICYCMDKDVIEKEDIDAVCVTMLSNHIFDMMDAIGERRTRDALNLYYDLIALKEAPLKILFMIARHCNILLQTKQLVTKGLNKMSIGDKLRMSPYIITKYMTQAGKFSEKVLKSAVTKCVQAEEDVKTGKLNDSLSVELLIMSVL